jgi:predicted nucleotidyltransferase
MPISSFRKTTPSSTTKSLSFSGRNPLSFGVCLKARSFPNIEKICVICGFGFQALEESIPSDGTVAEGEVMTSDIQDWVDGYLRAVKNRFGSRLIFVGLQGSYGRGEASESSDIDMVLILDEVDMQDLKAYDEAISKLPDREKICGFISGRRELTAWNKSELFQFYYDTIPIFGNMDFLLPTITKQDVQRAILSGACGLYHQYGHNAVHEKDFEMLRSLCKSAVFVLQAVYYDRTGVYVRKHKDLLPLLFPDEQQVMRACADLKTRTSVPTADFDQISDLLFQWAGRLIRKYDPDLN